MAFVVLRGGNMKSYRQIYNHLFCPRGNDYNFLKTLNYGFVAGFLTHALFILLFARLGIVILALLNIVSSAAYITCLIANTRGFFRTARVLAGIEIIIHAGIAVIYLGWGSGFHYYLICAVLMLFLSHVRSLLLKILTGSLLFATYIALYVHSVYSAPKWALSAGLLSILNCVNMFIALLMIAYLAHLYCMAVFTAEQKLLRVNRKLEAIAGTDPLTKISNRRKIIRELRYEAKNANRTGRYFALILADIDDFKVFNDIYCHECGDFVLEETAALIKRLIGRQGKVARWGGEEFLILLPPIQ